MIELEAVVSGKVHGVTYRDFVARKARSLWLTGYVENIPGYKVQVVGQGPKEKLEKLIEYLWKGPFGARVNDVTIVWREPKEDYHDFKINF